MEPCHRCADATSNRYSWGVVDDDARITRPLCDDCARVIRNLSAVNEFTLYENNGE